MAQKAENSFQKLIWLSCILVVLFFTGEMEAGEIRWVGSGTDARWSTPANWSSGTVPTALDSVIFDMASKPCSLDVNAFCSSVSFTPGYIHSFYFNNQVLSISQTADFSSGGDFIFSGMDTIKFTGTTLQLFIPPEDTISTICQFGTGGTTIQGRGMRFKNLVLKSGPFNMGDELKHTLLNSISMQGGSLNFQSCTLQVVKDLFLSAAPMTSGQSVIEFIGSMPHNFTAKPSLMMPRIIQNGSGSTTLMPNTTLRTPELNIAQGSFIMDTSCHIDSIYIGATGTLVLNNSPLNNDTIGTLQGSGIFQFNASAVHVKGDLNVSSMIDVHGTGMIAFIGATAQKFFPKPDVVLYHIAQNGVGTTTVYSNRFKAHHLTITAGEFNLGSGLKDSIGQASFNGGILHFGSCTLQVATDIDFSGLSGLQPGTGVLEFVGMTNQHLVPRSGTTMPRLLQNSTGQTVSSLSHVIRSPILEVRSGSFRMDSSFVIDTIQIGPSGTLDLYSSYLPCYDTVTTIVGSGNLNLNATILHVRGDLDLSTFSSVTNAGKILFIGDADHYFTPNPHGVLNSLTQVGPGTTTVLGYGFRANYFAVNGGVFNLGTGLKDSVGMSVSFTGGTLHFGSCTLKVNSDIDFGSLDSVIAGTGVLEFIGYAQKVFSPGTASVMPSIIQNGLGTTTVAPLRGLKAPRLHVLSGTLKIDTSFVIDTIQVGENGVLELYNASSFSLDTVTTLMGAGILYLNRSVLHVRGNLDLSTFSNVVSATGKISFIGNTFQSFTPRDDFTFEHLIQDGSGSTTVLGTGFKTRYFTVNKGVFNLGTGLKDSIGSASFHSSGTLDLGSCTLQVATDIDFSAPAAVVPGTGTLEFIGTGQTPQVFIPRHGLKLHRIRQVGTAGLRVQGNRLRSQLFSVENDTAFIDSAVIVDTISIPGTTGTLHLSACFSEDSMVTMNGAGRVYVNNSILNLSGDLDLDMFSFFAFGGDIRFTGTSGTQVFTPRAGAVHPAIIKTDHSTLSLNAHDLSCAAVFLNKGILNFNGQNISTTGDFVVSNGSASTFMNLTGRKITVGDDALFNGSIGDSLLMNADPGIACTLAVTDTLQVTYAKIGNIIATGSSGRAVHSVDLGGNVNWNFWAEFFATISLHHNRGYTADSDPSITLSATGADSMRIALESDTALAIWKPFVSIDSIDISSGGEGVKRIWAQFKNIAGARSSWIYDSTVFDSTPPSEGTVTIVDNSGYTNASSVLLSIGASGADSMRIALDSDTATALFKEYSVSDQIDLTAGGEGLKKVCVQFKDFAGNVSPWTYSSIIYDSTAPSVTLMYPGPNSAVNHRKVSFAVSEYGDSGFVIWSWVSGVPDTMSPRISVLTGTELHAGTHSDLFLTNAPDLVDGAYYDISIKIIDSAGNSTTTTNQNILFDTTAPTLISRTPDNNGTSFGTDDFLLTFNERIIVNTGMVQIMHTGDGTLFESIPVTDSRITVNFATLTINPLNDLVEGGVGYYILIDSTSITDLAGNRFSGFEDASGWGFVSWDTTAPVGTISIADSNGFINISDPVLNITASGADSMRMAEYTDTAASVWKPCSTTARIALSAGEGTKIIWIQFKDLSGNRSPWVCDTTIFDVTAPSGSISISDNGGYTNDFDLPVALFSDGDYLRLAEATDTAQAPWLQYTQYNSIALSGPEGVKRVYAQFRDFAGNVSPWVCDSTILDTTAPAGMISIDDRNGYTNNSSLSLIISETGADSMRIALSADTATARWLFCTGTDSLSIVRSGEGQKVIWIQFKDLAGNRSGWVSDTTVYDTVPASSIVETRGIFNSETWTGSITGTATDQLSGVHTVYISIQRQVDGFYWNGTNWSLGETLITADGCTNWSYRIRSGEFNNGIYVLSTKALDSAGNLQTQGDTASITWNDSGPVVYSLEIADNNGYTNVSNILFQIGATGADSMRIALERDTSNAPWKPYATADSINVEPGGEGVKRIFAQFKDIAGNLSAWIANSTTYDITAPAGTVTVSDSNGYVNFSNLELTIKASGADSMRIVVNDDTTDIPFVMYATKAYVRINGGEGQKIVRVQFRDLAGNYSSWGADTTVYDTSAGLSQVLSSGIFSSTDWPGNIYGSARDTLSGIKEVYVSVRNSIGQFFTGSGWDSKSIRDCDLVSAP